MSVGFVLTIIMVLTTEEKIFLSSSIISGHTELGVRMDRACAMLENINRSNLTGQHQVTTIQFQLSSRSSTLRDQSCVIGRRPKTVTTNENHERLLQQMLQSLKCNLRRTSLKIGVSDRSVRRMFKELGGFVYRIQVAQRLTETDERTRLQYCSRVWFMTYEQCVRREDTHFEHMLYRCIQICIVLINFMLYLYIEFSKYVCNFNYLCFAAYCTKSETGIIFLPYVP